MWKWALVAMLVITFVVYAHAETYIAAIQFGCHTDVLATIQRLQNEFGEAVRWHGLHQNRDLIQLWSSDQSWTLTLRQATNPGVICVLYAGRDNMFRPAPLKGELH